MVEEPEEGTAVKTKIEIGMDWDSGHVIIQSQAEGTATAMLIRIPLDAYVSSAVALGQQLLQRLAATQGNKRIVVAHPGQVPDDLRTH